MQLTYEAWKLWWEEPEDMIGQFDTPEEAVTAAREYEKVHGNDNGSAQYRVIVTGWED